MHRHRAALLPGDEHDRRLAAEVQPPGWANPAPAARYHLVVVGAGTGGLVSAAIAAALGARVALVERHLMGGDCLNVGCVPSKAVIRAARGWREARHAAASFGGPAVDGGGDFAAAMARMRRLRAGLAPVDGARRFSEMGIDVFLGEGMFVAGDALEVGGSTLRFRRAVIATGAGAALPPIPGLEAAEPLTNETVFTLTALPRRLVVLGAGPIGVELAQSFARFGSEVHLVDRGPRILHRDDPDAAAIVARHLEADGVRMHLGASVTEVERDGALRRVRVSRGDGEEAIEGEVLLVALGRSPNVEGLGLEAAGIERGPHGVAISRHLRTSNRRVYAVGDVASAARFTHAADAQARIVVQNALLHRRLRADRLLVPWATYTSPEVAHVGLTAAAAAARDDVETLTMPLAEVDRAVLDGAEDGFLRLHLARRSDRLLGATVVAEHAGDLVGELATAIRLRIGLGRLGDTIRPYPTQGEVVRRAADAWRRRRLTPLVRRLLGLLFR
jgi:pyruvate/2-oxoglutarate dehydrogenase complex dihydrolipoamide dehydrogenase (E3) component